MTTEYSILTIDDDPVIRRTLSRALTGRYERFQEAASGGEGLRLIENDPPDIVLLDIGLDDINGMEVLTRITRDYPDILVIMLTGVSRVPTIIEAIKNGAYYYITKPLDLNALEIILHNAREAIHLKKEVQQLMIRSGVSDNILIGTSPSMKRLFENARKLAATASTVLIQGETGTGKDVMAQYIHYNSERALAPLVELNCGAIPHELMESELFGYEKGAFTGALNRMKPGKFELADNGTLFLDEIGELPLDSQTRLLRVLETQRFYRVGGENAINVDVRIIAATNRDLLVEVDAGRFREDLFYRLNIGQIQIPPLRKRQEDILPLAKFFLSEFNKKLRKDFQGVDRDAEDLIRRYYWKGNIRELRNTIERFVLLEEGKRVTRRAIARYLQVHPGDTLPDTHFESPRHDMEPLDASLTLDEMIIRRIQHELKSTGGNISQTARNLGLSRSNLRYRLQKYGIKLEENSK